MCSSGVVKQNKLYFTFIRCVGCPPGRGLLGGDGGVQTAAVGGGDGRGELGGGGLAQEVVHVLEGEGVVQRLQRVQRRNHVEPHERCKQEQHSLFNVTIHSIKTNFKENKRKCQTPQTLQAGTTFTV